jgi:hypothetical protein
MPDRDPGDAVHRHRFRVVGEHIRRRSAQPAQRRVQAGDQGAQGLIPGRQDQPGTATRTTTRRTGIAFAVDRKLPETANVSEDISMVWVEYRDDSHVGHWQDTWRVSTERHSQGMFLQTESQLVD